MVNKNIIDMTIEEINAVEPPEYPLSVYEFPSIVLLPKEIHESGYRVMDFIGVNKKNMPICRISTECDVINLGGEIWVDILPCGLVRLFENLRLCPSTFSTITGNSPGTGLFKLRNVMQESIVKPAFPVGEIL